MRFGQSLWRIPLAVLVLVLLVNGLALPITAAQTPQWTAEPTAMWTAQPTPEAAAASPLTLVWQTKFDSDSILYSPGDVAVDSWGNAYVSTQSFNTIKKFDKDGNYVTQWGSAGKDDGQFNLSLGVSVDAANNIY